jgi:hypothetical protein
VVGSKVVFAPYNQHNVGIYDAASGKFSTIATTGAAAGGSLRTERERDASACMSRHQAIDLAPVGH